jgi:sporulation protein YlmC with PRC-barrel domain
MTPSSGETLRKLSESTETIDGSANDVRGRGVKDKNGEAIGKVQDLLIDDEEKKVRFLIVDHGGFLGFGQTRSFIPVESITRVTDKDVYIDHSREHVAAAPTYDPDLVEDHRYHSSVYSHYGYTPFSYMYPAGAAMIGTRLPPPRD